MLILETHASGEKEAIELSADYLKISSSQLEARLTRKGSSGFLGFGSKTPSMFQIYAIKDVTSTEAIIRGVLVTLLHKMGYKAKVIHVEQNSEDGKLHVELSSPQAGYIIGKYGRTLESLQFMVNLLVQNFTGEPPKILLDIEGYRQRRDNHLINLATKVGDTVLKTGKSRLLDPLNPYERRLIHVTLQDNEALETMSEGNGVYKRVRVRCKSKPEKGEKNFNKETVELNQEFDINSDEEINGNLKEDFYNENPEEPNFNSKEYQDEEQEN